VEVHEDVHKSGSSEYRELLLPKNESLSPNRVGNEPAAEQQDSVDASKELVNLAAKEIVSLAAREANDVTMKVATHVLTPIQNSQSDWTRCLCLECRITPVSHGVQPRFAGARNA